MDKEANIEITSKMITELTKEMHNEISKFTNSIKNQVNSYNDDRDSYEKFKITHEGPLFAEVNTKLFELLKEIKTLRKQKEGILNENPHIPAQHTSVNSNINNPHTSPYTSQQEVYFIGNGTPSPQNESPESFNGIIQAKNVQNFQPNFIPPVPIHSRNSHANHFNILTSHQSSKGEGGGILINQNFRSRGHYASSTEDPADSQPRFGVQSPREVKQLTPPRTTREEYAFNSGGSSNGFHVHRSPVRASHRSRSNSPNIISKPETVYSLPKQRLCKITDFNRISIYDRSGTQLFSEEYCMPEVGQHSVKSEQFLRFSKFKDKFVFFVDSHTICFIDSRLEALDPIYFKDEEYEIIDVCIDEIDENIIVINEICSIYYKNYASKFLSEDLSLGKSGEFHGKGISISESFDLLLIGYEGYNDNGNPRDKIALRKKGRSGYFRPYLKTEVEIRGSNFFIFFIIL